MNTKINDIVNSYKTEHDQRVFKIENNDFYIRDFNQENISYKKAQKNEFIEMLIQWIKIDIKELKLQKL